MKLSVVILNYNVKPFLKLCLQSVVKATETIHAEIIVIDNASIDGSMDMVAQDFPKVISIINEQNVGFSKANNQAVKVAKGEYICILNPDTVVAEDTFTRALNYAEGLPDLGALGIKLIDGTGHFLPESKRQLPTPKVALKKLLGKNKSYYAGYIPESGKDEVDVLVGAFMLMRRECYLAVKGFDEDYFMYGEDIDLSYKLTKAGFKNYYNGSISVIHFKGESTSRNKVYLERFYGAMSLFYQKHFSKGSWQNAAVDRVMVLTKRLKSLQNSEAETIQRISAYVYLGKDDHVVNVVEQLRSKTVMMVNKSELEMLKLKHSQLILDAETLTYKTIIELMERYKGDGNSFRIKPKGAPFILGSDSSDSKGEVLQLEPKS